MLNLFFRYERIDRRILLRWFRWMSRRILLLLLISCRLGDRGATGLKGARGISGIPGENGEPGIPGRSGMKGQKGENGQTTCYVTERGRRLEKPCIDASLYQQPRDESSGDMGGLTYIRWGRTTCPTGGARIVYSGNKAYYTRLINGCNPQFKIVVFVVFWKMKRLRFRPALTTLGINRKKKYRFSQA